MLETNTKAKYRSAILKIKEGEKLCRYSSGSFNKEKCDYPTITKEILAIIRETLALAIWFN